MLISTDVLSRVMHTLHALAFSLAAALLSQHAVAQATLGCGPFIRAALEVPRPRDDDARARATFEHIKNAVKTEPHRALFLGDSLTEGFNSAVWREHMAPRGVLNAGIGGDTTEELHWRLQNGNRDGPPPELVVLLIGRNDLARGRTPEMAAEGIRADLLMLRQRLPNAKILLLALWPRRDMPRITERHEIEDVNRLIASCADGKQIRFADLGGLLLEPDEHLSREFSPDLVHFNARGYARIAPTLGELIDQLLDHR